MHIPGPVERKHLKVRLANLMVSRESWLRLYNNPNGSTLKEQTLPQSPKHKAQSYNTSYPTRPANPKHCPSRSNTKCNPTTLPTRPANPKHCPSRPNTKCNPTTLPTQPEPQTPIPESSMTLQPNPVICAPNGAAFSMGVCGVIL